MASDSQPETAATESVKSNLVTVTLDWKMAHLVATACAVVADLGDIDPNDGMVLRIARVEIWKAIDAAL